MDNCNNLYNIHSADILHHHVQDKSDTCKDALHPRKCKNRYQMDMNAIYGNQNDAQKQEQRLKLIPKTLNISITEYF